MNRTLLTNGMRKYMLLAAMLLAGVMTAGAQDFYVIKAGDNFLSHNAALNGGLANATTFNATTCLWTVDGDQIVAISPDGMTGNRIGFTYTGNNNNRVYTLQLSASGQDWIDVSGNPYITYTYYYGYYSANRFLRLNGSTWEMTATDNNRATVTKLTFSDAPNTSSSSTTTYSTSVNGDDIIYSTSGTHTYTASVTQTITYTQTIRTFSGYANTGTTNATINKPYSVSSAYAGAANVNWSVTPTTYGTINETTGVLTITSLPACVDNITITYTAQADGQSITGTKTVMVAKDAATVEGVVGNPTGVSSTTVTLNDYEDHSWSYYSDPDCPIRSLSPANVKITYYGDGIVMSNNNNYTAGTNNYVSPGNANYVGGAKVNVGGENQNTFVYYKTLERGDATQTAWTFSSGNQSSAASRCPYTTIPNPFQVRPTYGARGGTDANNFTGWRGFQCWRLKSVTGGAVYSAASGGTALAVNAIINGETEIYFAPNSEYGMAVELEAVWARAYLVKGNNSNANAILNHGDLGVERNFMTLTTNENYRFNGASGRRITNVDRAVTISCYYPSGEAPDGTNGVVSGNNNDITLGADTKFENVRINVGGNYIYADGHNLIIGRGCSNSTAGYIQGYGSNGMDYSLRIESGTYTNFHALRRYTNNNYGTYSGTNKIRSTLGSDYDRAKTDNDKLTITGEMWMGEACRFSSESNGTDGYFKCWVKSGNLINGTISDGNGGGESFYLGTSGQQNASRYIMPRYLYMEGGIIAGVAGGLDDQSYTDASDFRVMVRMTGGYIRGCLYGAGSYARGAGERRYIITGGEIGGWVAAGCNGIGGNTTEANNGAMDGDSYIYIGGDVEIGYKNITVNEVEGGNVFGAGRGAGGKTYDVGTVNNSNLVVADVCRIEKNVYGGGNYGYSLGEANVTVLGGTVDGKIFGGANMTKGFSPTVLMRGGLVKGGVYGGCNTEGTINNNVTVQIDGGQVGTPSQNANVHGGGYGNATRTLNNVYVNIGSRTDCNVSGSAVIYGDVYGGSAEGKTNGNTARENNSVTNVTFNKGTIYGSLYGGGLGSASNAADVYGPVAVKVYGGTLTGGVYGANNVKGAPQNSVTVDIYGTDPQPGEGFAIANVYGGGNQAAYNNATYPTVTVHNCNNSIGNVYGGGNAAAVTNTNVTIYGGNRIGAVYAGGNGTGVGSTFHMVTGNAVAKIYGGTIDRVFAGNNSSGIVNGDKTVTINAGIDETTNAENCITCGNSPMKIGAVFHGGNQAAGSAGTVNIVCTGTYPNEYIDTLFGGANNADIVNNDMSTAEDVTLNIDRGYIRTGIFGGNNSGGAVTGDITINLTRNSGGTCAFDYPSVFGGGFGAGTSTGGDITINIGEKTATTTAPTINATIAGGAVYGGSALGSVNASSSDTTLINIYNGTIAGNIYGGGLGEADNATKGMVNGAVTVNIGTSDQTDGNCASDLTACSVYGCNNTGGSPQGDVTVNVYRTGHTDKNVRTYTAADATYAIDQVFGGGNQADYTPLGDNKATVHIFGCDNTIRRVFGGGNAAAALGVVTTIDGGRFDYVFGGGNGEVTAANIGAGGTNLTVNAGLIHYLFGGSNTSGTISGSMLTTVNNLPGCDEQIDNFFGGGNLADLGEAEHPISLTTTINCGTIFGDIYGGCNLANIYGDVTLTINGGTINNVYAGSKGVAAGDATYPAGKAANINGNVSLNIHAGDIGQAFGGSNINGNITGTVNVVLDWTQSDCSEKQIDYIYGASNDASYTPTAAAATGENFSPVVTLLHGTVDENVYGGGKGSTATVTAKPKVIAGDPSKNNNKKVSVMGDIFGGGNAAPVEGSTNVIVGHNSNVGRNVFGGGNAAPVSVDTEVEIKDKARISGNIYGGGNQGEIGGNTKVIVNGD